MHHNGVKRVGVFLCPADGAQALYKLCTQRAVTVIIFDVQRHQGQHKTGGSRAAERAKLLDDECTAAAASCSDARKSACRAAAEHDGVKGIDDRYFLFGNMQCVHIHSFL